MAHDLVFYKNRSTPQVVASGAAAKPKKGYGPQVSRRPAKGNEESTISKGKWLRVDSSGNTPDSGSYKLSSYRPKLAAKRRAAISRRLKQ